jgi:hypothetical protein
MSTLAGLAWTQQPMSIVGKNTLQRICTVLRVSDLLRDNY